MNLCKCGCNEEIIQKHNYYISRYISGHNGKEKKGFSKYQIFDSAIKELYLKKKLLCKEIAKIIDCNISEIYKRLHIMKIFDKKQSTERKSLNMKDKWIDKEYLEKMKQRDEHVWNKGLTKKTDERIKKYSMKLLGKSYVELHGEKKAKEIIERQKNNKFKTEEDHEKFRIQCRNRQFKLFENEEYKQNLINHLSRFWNDEEKQKRQSLRLKDKTYEELYGAEEAKRLKEEKKQFMKNKWNDNNFKEKTMKKVLAKICERPNNFERKCGEQLEEQFPNKFKYCGDGSVLINYKSPDYICEELKIVVL